MMQASIKPKPDNILRTKPSVRTCVVCRESSPAKELLGLKVLNQMLVADEKVAGRGAWVHLRAACLDGLELDLLEKALRTKIDFENQKAWLTNLRLLAQKRVLECVGLARRSGKLLIGLDHIGIGSDLVQGQPYWVIDWMRSGKWTKQTQKDLSWPVPTNWFRNNCDFPGIAGGLIAKGFSKKEVEKIMGGNWLRFIEVAFKPA